MSAEQLQVWIEDKKLPYMIFPEKPDKPLNKALDLGFIKQFLSGFLEGQRIRKFQKNTKIGVRDKFQAIFEFSSPKGKNSGSGVIFSKNNPL